MDQPANWIDRDFGWIGAAVLALAAFVGRAVMRLFDRSSEHENRLKILEDRSDEHGEALRRINDKIDNIPIEMSKHFDTRVEEMQAVLQAILKTCLGKGC